MAVTSQGSDLQHGSGLPSDRSIRAFRRGVLRYFRTERRDFPWRRSQEPYEVLVSELLLQRTRGEHVPPILSEFLSRWPSPQQLAEADEHEISQVIAPLGLVKRARHLHMLGRELAELSEVPLCPASLLPLTGVGRYTAHAVPIFAAGANLPLVDWVIARVLRRYFGLAANRRPNSDEPLWSLAERIVRIGRARDVWLGTLDLASAVCSRRPRCSECPLSRKCAYVTANADR